VRPATRKRSTLPSAPVISSAMPSQKNSFSGSALMLAKGSTAIDGCSRVADTFPA
jgi:hypothetical protein